MNTSRLGQPREAAKIASIGVVLLGTRSSIDTAHAGLMPSVTHRGSGSGVHIWGAQRGVRSVRAPAFAPRARVHHAVARPRAIDLKHGAAEHCSIAAHILGALVEADVRLSLGHLLARHRPAAEVAKPKPLVTKRATAAAAAALAQHRRWSRRRFVSVRCGYEARGAASRRLPPPCVCHVVPTAPGIYQWPSTYTHTHTRTRCAAAGRRGVSATASCRRAAPVLLPAVTAVGVLRMARAS
jgi:hypothetical protein